MKSISNNDNAIHVGIKKIFTLHFQYFACATAFFSVVPTFDAVDNSQKNRCCPLLKKKYSG